MHHRGPLHHPNGMKKILSGLVSHCLVHPSWPWVTWPITFSLRSLFRNTNHHNALNKAQHTCFIVSRENEMACARERVNLISLKNVSHQLKADGGAPMPEQINSTSKSMWSFSRCSEQRLQPWPAVPEIAHAMCSTYGIQELWLVVNQHHPSNSLSRSKYKWVWWSSWEPRRRWSESWR